jgi:hypothetical protein
VDDVLADDPTGVSGPDPRPDEGFPWWAALTVLIVLGGGAAVARSMKS